jgi:hypothetical protein
MGSCRVPYMISNYVKHSILEMLLNNSFKIVFGWRLSVKGLSWPFIKLLDTARP